MKDRCAVVSSPWHFPIAPCAPLCMCVCARACVRACVREMIAVHAWFDQHVYLIIQAIINLICCLCEEYSTETKKNKGGI